MTMTPNSPQELLELNSKKEVTKEEVWDQWLELDYSDKDNFIFHTLQFMRDFYSDCLSRELNKDNPDPKKICLFTKDLSTMSSIITLHESV